MKIICLVENTKGKTDCNAEHGLSLYVETKNHNILIDFGQTNMIIENSEKIGVDLTEIDTAFLSHGHYDHSGGLIKFSEINNKAKIYMQKSCFDDYYHQNRYIGIDKNINKLPNLNIINGDKKIDDELFLFTNIKGRKMYPEGNNELKIKCDESFIQDNFSHEQCLVISHDNKKYLLSGCAHNGIINILDRYYDIYNNYPAMVISGFHMMKKTDYTENEIKLIEETAKELIKKDILYVTGHCTSTAAFKIMKKIMGNKLVEMHSGDRIL